MWSALKRWLPDRPVPVRVRRGPFRGARFVANPRASLRKILGLYEHELNGWIAQALPRVRRVLDVGANDGYFAMGCAAALARGGRPAEIVCFEPQAVHVAQLRASIAAWQPPGIRFDVIPALVGNCVAQGVTTLDAHPATDRIETLIKIDVEGAEGDVLAGAQSWVHPSNVFLVEVHSAADLPVLKRWFDERRCPVVQVDQRPLPILGGDLRSAENWWLVTDLRGAGG